MKNLIAFLIMAILLGICVQKLYSDDKITPKKDYVIKETETPKKNIIEETEQKFDLKQQIQSINIDFKIENKTMQEVIDNLQEVIAKKSCDIKIELRKSEVQVENVSFETSNSSLKDALDLLSKKNGYIYYISGKKIVFLITAKTKAKIKKNKQKAPIANDSENIVEKNKQPKQREKIEQTKSIDKNVKMQNNISQTDFEIVSNDELSQINNIFKSQLRTKKPKAKRKYFLNIDISQKVNRLYSGENGSNNATNVRKVITVKMTCNSHINLIVCYYCNVASEYKSFAHLRTKFETGTVDKLKPFIFEFVDVTPSYRNNFEDPKYRQTYGNAKMQSAVFVFNRETGELINKRGTKDNFLKYIEANKKSEMESYVKRIQSESNTENSTAQNSYIRTRNFPITNKNDSSYIEIPHKNIFIFTFTVYKDGNNIVYEKIVNNKDNLFHGYSVELPIKNNLELLDACVFLFELNNEKPLFSRTHVNEKDSLLLKFVKQNYLEKMREIVKDAN